MISGTILADSINPAGNRLTSFLLTYPRFIHSELMTYRAFSRNAASSRAIPFKKMMQMVREFPAMPELWPSEKPGMSGGEPIPPEEEAECGVNWEDARSYSVSMAENCHSRGLHKSLCNRLLEPWSHMTTLVTASDNGFANFFAQRAHPDAQPEFQVLAYRTLDCYIKSTPKTTIWGGWHVPAFGEDPTASQHLLDHVNHKCDPEDQRRAIKIATARCARLSYLTHEGVHDPAKDIELHDKLAKNGHFSPFEHCAQAIHADSFKLGEFHSYPWSNFDHSKPMIRNGKIVGYEMIPSGWGQYRKLLQCENQTDVNLEAILGTKPDWIKL